MARRRQVDERAQQAVEQFNARYPVGSAVHYWRGVRAGEGVLSTTRSPAALLGGHTAVVWVEGYTACLALTHVEPVDAAVES
jgi:hypothetical protein